MADMASGCCKVHTTYAKNNLEKFSKLETPKIKYT